MVATQEQHLIQLQRPVITWEALPDDFKLEQKLVENTAEPLIAGTLRDWGVEKVEQERQRTEKLAEFLRSQGINPDEIC